MKSIIEEASSIFKAVENAWKRAEQPAEFSIQIFEIPQKNLFGFTTKSAKIGFFFDDAKPKEKQKTAYKPKSRPEIKQEVKPAPAHVQPKLEKKPIEKPRRPEVETEPWSPEMVEYMQGWLNNLFNKLAITNKTYTVDPQRYHLKLTFNSPIFEQEEKNRAFFRNCAHLMLQSVRNTYKRPLKGFKIILTVG